MGWRWGTPPPPPPPRVWTGKQTETFTFPHPSDAGGKNREHTEVTYWIIYDMMCDNNVARVQEKQGLYMFIFPDRENTGN